VGAGGGAEEGWAPGVQVQLLLCRCCSTLGAAPVRVFEQHFGIGPRLTHHSPDAVRAPAGQPAGGVMECCAGPAAD
jgi:hypothetical protein